MLLRDVYDFLDNLSPFNTQDDWDNSGLLVGEFEQDVERIYLSLDIDTDLIDSIEMNSLLVTHHPLIFKGLKRVVYSTYPSNILKKMIQKNISLISMHTNFDKSHLNIYVAKNILGFDIEDTQEYVCYFRIDKDFNEFALHVKQKLGIEYLKTVKASDFIGLGAITTGSGGDLIESVKADCFLSGDFKYHQALYAKENGLSLIEIGHYESERFFGESLMENLKNLPLKVIMSNSKNPFDYI